MPVRDGTIYRPNAAAFPVNDNMPGSMPVAPERHSGGVPRFLDDEISGASPRSQGAAATAAPAISPGVVIGFWLRVLAWRRHRAARIALHALDDRMLSDIGLARCDIEHAVSQIGSAGRAYRSI